MSPDAFHRKRQGTLKSDSEWRTARRMGFAIQCSPRRSPFAAPFAVHRAIRRSPRHSPRHSPFAAPFAIRRAIRRSPRHSPFTAQFAASIAIRRAVSYYFFQCSLIKVRYSMFAAPFAVHHSLFAEPFAATFAIAFQCPLTLSIRDTCHTRIHDTEHPHYKAWGVFPNLKSTEIMKIISLKFLPNTYGHALTAHKIMTLKCQSSGHSKGTLV